MQEVKFMLKIVSFDLNNLFSNEMQNVLPQKNNAKIINLWITLTLIFQIQCIFN